MRRKKNIQNRRIHTSRTNSSASWAWHSVEPGIPNYMKYLDYAKVDEAKALLNSTAADCLQGLRRKGEERLISPVNDDVISFTRLKNTGYIFKDGSKRSTDEKFLPNCSTVLITAAQEADRTERLPDLGFTLTANGTLTKIAVDSGSETKFPAESWAGINTTEETELVEWQELNDAITKAKASLQKIALALYKAQALAEQNVGSHKTSNCTTNHQNSKILKPALQKDAQKMFGT